MTTLAELRARAEKIAEEFSRNRSQLFRADGQPVYGAAEHEERLRTLERERARQLDAVIEEVLRLVAEAEGEIAGLENGDPTRFLSTEELAGAAARKVFVDDDVWNLPQGQLAARLRVVLAGGDRVATFCYWRAGEARYASILEGVDSAEAGRPRVAAGPEGLRSVLDDMRDTLAGPERLARVERARKTLEEAPSVELLASNLKRGARSASGAWVQRRVGSAL